MLSRSAPNKNSHILILGHTGFIGKNLIKYLERKLPEVEIVGKSSYDIDLTSENATAIEEFSVTWRYQHFEASAVNF